MMQKVSVIIPCYNYGRFLEECINSVLQQTYKNTEIIVINNASTDNTEEICMRYRNIRYIKNKTPHYASYCRNQGIRVAQGEYILFLDADDYLLPTYIEKAVNILENNRTIGLVYTDCYWLFNDGTIKHWKSEDYNREILLDHNYITNNSMFRKSLISKVGTLDESLSILEDYDFWLKITSACDAYRIPEPLFYYRKHNQNKSSKNSHEERKKKMLEINQKYKTMRYDDDKLVSILICAWNNLDLTLQCLQSVVKNTRRPYEIILVDNNSSEHVCDTAREYLTQNNVNFTIIVNSENKGFVKATNQAIKLARGEYIVFLNNDVQVTQGWLSKMISVYKKDPAVGIVGCLASPSEEGWQCVNHLKKKSQWLKDLPEWEGKSIDEYAKIIENKYRGRYRIMGGMVAFFCTVVKKELIKTVGILSEEYEIGLGDDDDYCERAKRKGYKIALALDTYVYHKHRATFKKMDLDVKEIQKKNTELFKRKFNLDKLKSNIN